MRARSFAVTLPSASALFSILCTRAWPFSSRAASLFVSAPDFSPCSMRCSWLACRLSMRGVLVCERAGSVNAANAAAVTKLTNFMRRLLISGCCETVNARNPAPMTLLEIGPDQAKGVGHHAVHPPAQQSPRGDSIVDRPAKQAIARLLDGPGPALAQMPLIAMKSHAVKRAQPAQPVCGHLIHEETARQIRRRRAGGFERDARERRQHRLQRRAAPELARHACDGLARGTLMRLRRFDLDVRPNPELAAEPGRIPKARDIELLEFRVRRKRNLSLDPGRALERLVVDQDRRAVPGQHDVELNAAEAERRPEPNCGERVLGGERPAAAVSDDSRVGPAHDALEVYRRLCPCYPSAPSQPEGCTAAARVRETARMILGRGTTPDRGMLSSGLSSLRPEERCAAMTGCRLFNRLEIAPAKVEGR